MIKCFRPVRSSSRRKCQLRTERGWAFISSTRNSMFENQPRDLTGRRKVTICFFNVPAWSFFDSYIYRLINQHSSNIISGTQILPVFLFIRTQQAEWEPRFESCRVKMSLKCTHSGPTTNTGWVYDSLTVSCFANKTRTVCVCSVKWFVL